MGCKKETEKGKKKEAKPGDYRCQKCDAVAKKKKNICKPQQIKK